MNKPKENKKGSLERVSGFDICQTPPYALDCIRPYIYADVEIKHPTGKHFGHDIYRQARVWESAAGPELLLVHALRDEGFEVYATDLLYGEQYNFFTCDIPNVDYHITNPPYSIKYEWLARAFEISIPFALLVPYETTFAAKFQRLFHQYHEQPWRIEVISPERRINFKMPDKGWSGAGAQMPTCWVTWGLHVQETRQLLHETGKEHQLGFTTYYAPMERRAIE